MHGKVRLEGNVPKINSPKFNSGCLYFVGIRKLLLFIIFSNLCVIKQIKCKARKKTLTNSLMI